MKKMYALFAITVFVIMSIQTKAQDCTTINAPELKSMLVNMGYEVTELDTAQASKKYQVKHYNDGLHIYISYQLSASTNFVWLTAILNTDSINYKPRIHNILKQNTVVQPAQFYINKNGTLMFGLAAENRGMTAAILRRHIDFVCNNIAKTKEYWMKQ